MVNNDHRGEPYCPFCKSEDIKSKKVNKQTGEKLTIHECNDCGQQFVVIKKTTNKRE